MQFHDRTEAGEQLAARLVDYAGAQNGIVLALPRGGIAIGVPAAEVLEAELDVFVVRKVGAPHQEELAIGAVASGGVTVRNEDVLQYLGVSDEDFESRARIQRSEVLRRETLYRGDRPAPELHGRVVVLVDDGLATGASMRAAATAVRKMRPEKLIIGVPVAAQKTALTFRNMLDRPGEEFICLHEPSYFGSVGQWYVDFRQIDDEEVCAILNASARCGGKA